MAFFEGATQKLALIEPKVFSDYITMHQTATNRLLTSGLLQTDAVIQSKLLQGGTWFTVPALNAMSGEEQAWNDTDDIKVDGTSSKEARFAQIYQVKAFGYRDFARLTTGAPLGEQIAAQFGDFWNVRDEALLIAVLENTFKNEDLLAAKSYGVATPKELTPGDFIAALTRMGDMTNPKLTRIVTNSATVGAMREQNLIDTVQPSEGGVPISYYNGIQIIQDDALDVAEDGTTAAYIISTGAMGYAKADPANAYEVVRDALGKGGQTSVINRRTLSMQLRGMSLTEKAITDNAGKFSTAGFQKANESLFELFADPRDIGIVKYAFKVDPKFRVAKINAPAAAATTPTDDGTEQGEA